MYRYRRRRKLDRRRRRALSAVALSAVLALAVGIPTLAAGDPVNDTLNNVGLGSGSGGSSGGASPNSGVPGSGSGYIPPLHGSNSHGQGTNAIIDLQPENANPYPGTPDGSEELIVGDARGEQNSDGNYHGSAAFAYLFGNAILGAESDPGESDQGPLADLNDGLAELCAGSDGQVCLEVMKMDSTTTASGSSNEFKALGVHLQNAEDPSQSFNLDLLHAQGNISEGTDNSGNKCQVANGHSKVLEVDAGGNPVVDAFESNSASNQCAGTVSGDSYTLKLGGEGVPFPDQKCPDGQTFETTDIAPLLAAVCNATDTSGVTGSNQATGLYGVQEALVVFALLTDDSSLLKLTLGKSESRVPPPPTPPTTPTTPSGGTKGAGGKGGKGGGGGAGEGAGGGPGAAAGEAAAGGGELAFTGADLLALGMVGGALILGGLALTTTAGRRHRQTV